MLQYLSEKIIPASVVLFLTIMCLVGVSRSVHAEDFIGQIIMLPYTFCPAGYKEAEGQLLKIADYAALYSLLGTQYGGDGQTTFALPKLHGASETGSGKLKVCIAVNGIYPQRP